MGLIFDTTMLIYRHWAIMVECEKLLNIIALKFCLFDLILYVHSTIFQLCGTGLPGLNQY